MSIFDDLPLGKSKKSEPAWHPAIKRSFLFIPTAGMRVAPEVLVLEIFREIFFSQRSEESSARSIDPAEEEQLESGSIPQYSSIGQAILYASRGRRKQNRQSVDANFYTPGFPSLARRSWLRKKSDRVVWDFLFRALSQKIYGKKTSVEEKTAEVEELIYSALVGNNTVANPDQEKLDITGLDIDILEGCCSKDKSLELLRQHLGETSSDPDVSTYNTVFDTPSQDDPLASQIHQDFMSLCELEGKVDRLKWLELLKCFLRLSTSIWLLAQMQLTVFVRDTLLGVLQGQDVPLDSTWPYANIRDRYVDILRPSIAPTGQIYGHIDTYMRARVELNLFVALVEKYSGENWRDKTITASSGGSGALALIDLMSKARSVREHISNDLAEASLKSVLTRECEKYKAWVSPRKKGSGQGVNYDEFLRVLRRMTKGDEDGGFLLTPAEEGFVVFPGQLMLKLITFFSGITTTGHGLVLADVEKHFSGYGIDFGKAAGARPRLISVMQEIGMLKGSPDAGDSVAIERQYNNSGS